MAIGICGQLRVANEERRISAAFFLVVCDLLVAPAPPPATTATATAAAVATAATTAATTVTTVSTARAILAGLGFVDGERAPAVLLAVERRDGRLGLGVATHLDEAESLASAGVAIGDDLRALHRAVRGEQRFQCRAIDVVAQISNI